MKKVKAKDLIKKYLVGSASAEEKILVERWFLEDLKSSTNIPGEEIIDKTAREIRTNLIKHIGGYEGGRRIVPLRTRISVAAAVLLIFSTGLYYIIDRRNTARQIPISYAQDLAPGGNKAFLTLSNGKRISLNDTSNGKIAKQGFAIINKTNDGRIIYHDTTVSQGSKLVYNTMSTPRGGIYHLTLADGTNVILNSESSITYPTSFSGSDRTVTLTGEAYFEVKYNAEKPFKVLSRDQVVEDLGTHFNVNAYIDEVSTKTTLLEGKVKITSPNQQSLYLKPGQQSHTGEKLTLVIHPDLEEATAWKDGFFHFDQADIPTVMRALARWYNVDVEFKGQPTNRRFSGDIYRNVNASQALEILSLLKIEFRIEGRKIIVIQ